MTRASYLPSSLRVLHLLHRRFPPVPAVQYFFSMLLPSVHLLLLWYTSIPGLLECQGLTLVIRPTSSLNRLTQHSRDETGESTKRKERARMSSALVASCHPNAVM